MAAATSFAHAAPKAVIASLSDVSRTDQKQDDSGPVGGLSSAALGTLLSHAVTDGSSGSAPYPRTARMLTPAEFDRCLRRPALFRSGSFALHLEWIADVDRCAEPAWRLGLVIPKRYEASAVARNTIKRRWRDAFRRGRSNWAAEFGSADVVVRLQAPLMPKPPKAARGVAKAPVVVLPARVRARDRFDPVALCSGFVERLRSRGGRPASVVGGS